jgi:hypothetical protein
MNSLKQSGNYAYHLLQHSTALPLALGLFMRYVSCTVLKNTPTVCLTDVTGRSL